MYIRCNSWGRADISWSSVQEQLLRAAKNMGHNPIFISTNGYEGMEDWSEEKARSTHEEHKQKIIRYDIDMTYASPNNFAHRFLPSSKVKIGKFDFESTPLPEHLHKFLNDADFIAGSSDFVCNLFREAGVTEDRLMCIPNGVDRNIFNESVPALNLEKIGIKDRFVYLAVAEPHYRKQLDRLCETFCETFKGNQEVALVIKTKIANTEKGFEQDIRPILKQLSDKYGDQMPMIKMITSRLKSLASLYAACDVFCLPTVGEGWGMPFLEAMACGKLVIAPNYGGQLHFLSNENSLLCPVTISEAMSREQYQTAKIDSLEKAHIGLATAHKGFVGRPDMDVFGQLMIDAKNNLPTLLAEKKDAMKKTADKFTWEFAVSEILRRIK